MNKDIVSKLVIAFCVALAPLHAETKESCAINRTQITQLNKQVSAINKNLKGTNKTIKDLSKNLSKGKKTFMRTLSRYNFQIATIASGATSAVGAPYVVESPDFDLEYVEIGIPDTALLSTSSEEILPGHLTTAAWLYTQAGVTGRGQFEYTSFFTAAGKTVASFLDASVGSDVAAREKALAKLNRAVSDMYKVVNKRVESIIKYRRSPALKQLTDLNTKRETLTKQLDLQRGTLNGLMSTKRNCEASGF